MTDRRRRALYAVRKCIPAAILLAAVAALVLADRWGLFGRAPRPDLEKYDFKTFAVLKVIDGDTLDVKIPDGPHRRTRIRLWGVDTPELNLPPTPPQHFAKEAAEFARSLAMGKDVRLELVPHRTRDKYNRLLAYVTLPDGRMLNKLLIAEGAGYADPRFDHPLKSRFASFQRAAKVGRRGLWKDLKPRDLPYYYRNKIKLNHPD
ncbi:MAG: thermonuclease family protein [Planctomycetota bacterium]|nr:thermonuclease family protein [Planctomycetota bacterium]